MTTERRGPRMSHPLGQKPDAHKRLPEGRLQELALKIKEGTATESEITEVAKSYIRYAIKVAASVSNTYNDHDCASAGLFGVVYAVRNARDKLRQFSEAEPTATLADLLHRWVSSCIKRHINRFRELNHIVRIPESSYRMAKKNGKALETIRVVSLDDHPTDCRRPTVRRTGSKLHEIRELLTLSVQKEHDATIIKLRSQGYKDCEIAGKIGMSVAYVQRCRAGIEERFDNLNKD